jgi:hypothetical protein
MLPQHIFFLSFVYRGRFAEFSYRESSLIWDENIYSLLYCFTFVDSQVHDTATKLIAINCISSNCIFHYFSCPFVFSFTLLRQWMALIREA